jgi:hypothetical protein
MPTVLSSFYTVVQDNDDYNGEHHVTGMANQKEASYPIRKQAEHCRCSGRGAEAKTISYLDFHSFPCSMRHKSKSMSKTKFLVHYLF